MITRRHRQDGTASEAVYSACDQYRYLLTRVWDSEGKRVLFVMLNPSKATEQHNDPTVERCERRARALGYGAFGVANLFAWRATDPRDLRAATAPVGPENDIALQQASDWCDTIIAAWGTHGAHLGRDAAVAPLLRGSGKPLLCLGRTKAGHPRHPLYVGYSQQPLPWTAP